MTDIPSINTAPPMPAVMHAPMLAPQTEGAALIMMIERAARDPSIDLSKLRELIEMRNAARRQEAEIAFDEAMTAAQSEMTTIARDSSNPQTRSKYASLAAVDNALRPIYTRHRLSISFNTAPGPNETWVRVLCRVARSGYSRDYQVDMPADGRGAKGGEVMTRTHATGSAITYGRRYLLMAIFNLATDDDDANAAGRIERKPPPPAPNVMDTVAIPAAAAAPPIQPPKPGGAAPPSLEDLARREARKGEKAFKAFYRLRSIQEKHTLSAIHDELRGLMQDAAMGPAPP